MTRVCLDIDAVSRNARSEKSARHGHISTLGFWFARRPTGLCRAVIVAAGLNREKVAGDSQLSSEVMARYPEASSLDSALTMLTSELSRWSAFQDDELMGIARCVLKRSGCKSAMDPFGGGGSIPLEAARLGLGVGTGDLNPAAAILLRAMLKVLPAAGPGALAAFDAVIARVGQWTLRESRAWLPPTDSGEVAAILWAWNMTCPKCSDTFPLISNPLLSEKAQLSVGLRRHGTSWAPRVVPKQSGTQTIAQGNAQCPNCATEIGSKVLMEMRKTEAMTELPYAIVKMERGKGRSYVADMSELEKIPAIRGHGSETPGSFEIPLDPTGIRHLWAMAYGVTDVSDVFSTRQIHELTVVMERLRREVDTEASQLSRDDAVALRVLSALVAVRLSLYNSRHSWWQGNGEFPAQTFVRQALSMVWNYCEMPPSSTQAGGLVSAAAWVRSAAEPLTAQAYGDSATVWCGPAEELPLESASIDLIVTDPPYFDSITYAYLSDVFYPVYRFMLAGTPGWDDLVVDRTSPRQREAIVDRPHKTVTDRKTAAHFQEVMTQSFGECRRVIRNSGTLVVMYGHKSDEAWVSLLEAIAEGGFLVTDAIELVSERAAKFQHQRVEHLEDSVALFCAPSRGRQGSMAATLDEIRALVLRNRLQQ